MLRSALHARRQFADAPAYTQSEAAGIVWRVGAVEEVLARYGMLAVFLRLEETVGVHVEVEAVI